MVIPYTQEISVIVQTPFPTLILIQSPPFLHRQLQNMLKPNNQHAEKQPLSSTPTRPGTPGKRGYGWGRRKSPFWPVQLPYNSLLSLQYSPKCASPTLLNLINTFIPPLLLTENEPGIGCIYSRKNTIAIMLYVTESFSNLQTLKINLDWSEESEIMLEYTIQLLLPVQRCSFVLGR